MDTFSVVFYETLSGDKPAKVFLDELSDKQRAKTIRDLKDPWIVWQSVKGTTV